VLFRSGFLFTEQIGMMLVSMNIMKISIIDSKPKIVKYLNKKLKFIGRKYE
jgi:hypothetical protein